MPKGGANQHTWKKGHGPGKPEGVKHQSTRLKETLGPAGWDKFKTYMETDGADKLIEAMSNLKGRDFVWAFSIMAPYVKPQLQRIDANVRGKVTFTKAVKFS